MDPWRGGGTWGSVEARSAGVQKCSASKKAFQNPFSLLCLPPLPSHQPGVVGVFGESVGSTWVHNVSLLLVSWVDLGKLFTSQNLNNIFFKWTS